MVVTKTDRFSFLLRMPYNLKRQLESAAKENHRSVTAEIVKRLEDSFRERYRQI